MRKRNKVALILLGLFIFVFLMLILINTFLISIMGYHFNSATDMSDYAANVTTKVSSIEAKRGMILDRNGEVIASDIESYTVYAIVDENRPSYKNKASYVVDKEYTAKILSELLEAPYDYVLDRLNSASYQTEFGLYGSKLSQEIKDKIDENNLPGVGFTKTYTRFYPLNVFASHVIGYVAQDETALDRTGKMGIENTYNDYLAGTDGQLRSVVDRSGYVLPGYSSELQTQKDGSSIKLTIDRSLQEQLESSFLESVEIFGATEAFGAIMEVDSGKLLALGQYPSFDPNLMNVTDFKNYATQYVYEPGSTIKTFTYAAAIDTGVYNGSATFNSSPYLVSVNKDGDPYRNLGSNALVIGTIRNAHNRSWGVIDYDTGYAMSSNVGIASLLTTQLDLDVFREYLVRFGFDDAVKVDGFSESIGNINFSWPYEKLTVGFGQGITINMMQLLQAYTAVFNQGIMVKPYVVDQITDVNTNELLFQAETEVVGQPISSSTADQLQDLMFLVTQEGEFGATGRAYTIDEVDILAKTGTAQIFVDGEYSNEEFLYSVVIGLPAENPKVMLYYAFRAPATLNAHFKTDPVKKILKQISLSYSMNATETKIASSAQSSYPMSNFMNHTLSYALENLDAQSSNIYVLGNSNSVLDQYPKASTLVLKEQSIFLLTSRKDIKMINLENMTRKDVVAFSELVGITLEIEGEGRVVEQSITPDTLLEMTSHLKVILK